MADREDKDVSVSSNRKEAVPVVRLSSTISIPIKYLCLILLVVQTSVNVVMLRYSRTSTKPGQPVYVASTAVLMGELVKAITCYFVLLYESKGNIKVLHMRISHELFGNWKDGLKLIVPAGLYVVQNNLLFLALSNLDAATYQVTYQLKIFTTAIFYVILLGKRLSLRKWFALFVLLLGACLVQWPKESAQAKDLGMSQQVIGLVAVLCACVSSGFAGVYFEKILKGSPITMWIRNIQLAAFSVVFCIAGILVNDFNKITTNGFFSGYNPLVVFIIIWGALGGLLIGAVVKYADNISKGFAAAVSIVCSSLLSYVFIGDFEPSLIFAMGACCVMVSTYMYSLPDDPK